MFQDLGSKPSGPISASPEKDSEKKIYYPNLHLTLDKVPDLKLGEDVEVKVKLCVSGLRKDYDGKRMSVDFDVKAIDFGAAAGKSAMSEDGQKLSKMVEDDNAELNDD
jgi:hypothetical protein